jgi:hypothetical protein
MAKKRTGLDALREYEARSGRQTQSGNQQTGNAGSSGGTWRSGLDALREYEASGGRQNVTNGPYNPDYRTNTKKATPQSYEAAYQQYKQYVAEYQKQTEFPRRVSVGTAAQQAGGSQKRDYSRMLGLNQLDGDMQPRVQAAQDIQKYLQFQRKVQTGTAAQQAATNAGQDYSRLIGLNQFDGELERRAAEQEKRYRETVLPDQLRGMKRTSAEIQKQLDQLYEQKSDEHFRDYQFDENGTAWYTDENGTRRQARGVRDIQSEIDTLETRKAALDSARALGQAENTIGALDEETRELLREYNKTGYLADNEGAEWKLRQKGYSYDQIKRLAEYEKYLEDFEDYQKRSQSARKFGQDAPVTSTVASSLLAPFKALGNIESLRGILPKWLGGYQNEDMPTNIYSPLYFATHESSGIRSGVMEGMGPVGQFLYQAGTSALDSAVNMAASTAIVGTTGLSGEAASSAVAETMNWVMGSQVAADSVYAGIQSGKSNQEALIDGIVEGAIEGLTEKYSVGDKIKTMLSGKQVWKKVMRAFASEGAEEIASNWLNRIYDVVAKHDRGEVMGAYAEYLSKGNTKEKALALTLGDMLKEDGLSFLAGGISGLAMSGAYAGTNKAVEARNRGKQLNVIGQVMDAVESMAKERGDQATAEAAQAVMDKVKAGQMPETAEVQAVVNSAVKADQAAQAEAAFQTYNQYADERDARQAAREARQQAPAQAVQEAERQQQTPAQTTQAVQEVQNVQTQTGKRTQADAGRRAETREIDFNKEPQLTKYEQAQAKKDRVFSLEPERRDEIFGSWSNANEQFAKRTKQIERDYTDRYGINSGTAVDIAYMMNWLNSRFINSYLSTLTVENEEEARILTQETREIFEAAQAKASTELSGYTRDATLEAIQAALELIPGGTETQQMQKPSRAEQQQITQEAEAPKPAPAQAASQAVQETEELARETTLPGPKQAEQTATQEEAPVQETNKKGAVRLEEQQENVVPDGGSRRESDRRAGKPFGAVAGRTGKTNAAAQQSRTAVERQNRARDLRLPKVSTVELGVSRGTGYRGNTVFMRENWDAGMKETAARVKQRTGLETTYVLGPLQVRTSNGGTARAAAVFTGDRIIVQADNLRATIDQLASHETYHWIADNTPGLNAQIEQHIRDTFSEEEFDQIVETYIRSRRGVNDVPTEGTDAEFDEALNAIKEEIYADAYAGINAFGTHAEQYQQTVREAAELRTTAQTAEKTGGTRGPPEKYSIGKTTDNKPFVEVEQDILAGVPEADWVKTIKENLKKKFPNGITVGNNEINIDYQSRQEMTFSRYMQWLYNNDPQLRADKLRATDNADEILRATTDWVNEGLNHPRKDKIADFARGNVLLRVGGNGYTAEVVVGTRESGSMLLYDILNLQPTSFTEKETDAAKAENPSPGTNRNTASVSEPSIRRTEQKSQEKFSVTEAADGQEDKRRSERVNLPTIAQRELKSTLFKMFSVSKTQRTDVGRVIDYFADRIYTNGELTQTDRDVFLARLYSSGAMMESLRQQPDAVPDIVGDGRLYVSERARREFGSEWNDFRKRAFEAGIYLTDSTADRSAEAWTQALSEAAPDTFSETGGSQRQKLEQIVQAAEEAQDQNLSLSEYAQALAGKDFVSDDAILENMERQLDWAMRTFAEKAKLEVKLRGDKTAAIEAERDRSAQRNAQRSQNNAGVIEAMEARTDERLQKKDAATDRSRQKLIEAMEARTDERLQKKDAALAKSKGKLIDAMEARIDERIQREKAREANRRALERQDRKDMAARQKARRELQELQKKTLKTLQWLNKNRFRAPEELREQFDEVLSDIDLYAVGTANEMQWSGKYNATWRDLAQMYQDAKANDPNFLPSKELERIVTRLDARKIGDMDLDALGKLYQAAVELRTEFANRNRVLGDAEERIFEDVYADSVREINSAAGGYTGKLTDRFMNMEQLSTMNVLERMAGWNPNSTWYGMAKQLEKGERDAQSYQVTAAQILKDFMQKNREWVMRSDGQGKDAIWYEIKVPELLELGMGDKPIFGKTVTVYMTPAQKVHMYLESRNYDNLRHMAGGRTFANRELYSKGKRQEAFAQGTTVKLAPETVKAIVSDLTVEEKALADVLDRYYNGYAKSEINRVSNILYGYDKAMGKNYAPIFTNSSFTKSEPGIYDATAEGVGNLKTRQVSKNPTYNIGAYDAFERNVSQTSRFVGMAIPARNWKTLLNWRGSTTSMKTVIDGKWGEVTEKYIMDQLTKLEAGGSSEQDFVTTAADKIFSNYIAATFGFNPSIVFKQAGSIPLAAAYLGAENTPSPKQIAQIDRTLISKYTKMLDYRLMGYATPETKQLKDHPTKIQNNKVLNFAFGGGAITAMDGWAASTLWPWAENAVRRENPELEIGTQEQIDAGQSPFYQKVAERFNDAVARSQSTSDEMHQGRLRKSKNALAKAVTMFRSDSAQVYNTVRQAIGEAQYYKRSGASIEVQRRANRRVGQAFVSAAGGYIWSTAVTFLMALLKHRDKKYRDDDGNLTALSVLKGMGEDLLSSIAGAASIGGEEVVELIGGTLSGERFYDIFNSQSVEQLNKVLELIDTHGKNINKFVTDGADLIKNKGDLTLYLKRYGNDMLGDIRNLAKEIATYGFSLPANNLETYILGTVKTVSPALGTAYDDAMQTANRNLLKGLTGDALRMRVQHVFQVRDVDVSSEAVQAVARLYEAGYANAAPADTPSSVNIHDEKRELKAYQKQTYDMVWSEAVRNSLNELVQSDAFQSAGDDQQAKMLAKLYDYAAEQAKGVLFDDYEADAYVEKFKKLADNGVPESASIAYSVMAANVEGEKDADGKTISGSKRDEAMGILDGMELTGSQKSALLAANYSATGFEPWSGYREALKAGGDTWDAFYQNAVSAKVADGKAQEDAEKAVKSDLKSQLKEDYLGGSMPESEVSDYLQKYCGAEDEHDVYWTLEEWKGGEGWKKYGQFLDAVDKGVLADTRKVAKEYMKHGVDKGDLSSQLTKHFKEAWLAATGDEATRLKNAYISAYKAIGGDADKARDNIIKWRREANKRKGDKK